MKTVKLLTILLILSMFTYSYGYIIEGSVTVPVVNDNIKAADRIALERALLKSLKNYFHKLKKKQPNMEVPDVTTEFFKFIRSYKIAERGYQDDAVFYTVLTDVDDVALNDLMYFVKQVVNSAVYNVRGMNNDTAIGNKISETLAEYKFHVRYQSEYQSQLLENSSNNLKISAFRNSPAQYYFDLSIEREPAQTGYCTAILTTKTYSKTKEFKTLKTNSQATANSDEECMTEAFTLAFIKTLGYVRENFIPLPSSESLKQFTVTAENYDNFATPKKIMEELKKRTFIKDYKIKGFSGKKLEIEITTFIGLDLLIKKLQSIESEYDFSAHNTDGENILLDFNAHRE